MRDKSSAEFPLLPDAFAEIALAVGGSTLEQAAETGARSTSRNDPFSRWIVNLQDHLATTKYAVVSASPLVDSKDAFARLCTVIGAAMGDLVVQNAEGARIIEVFDRGIGRLEDGVRYHQTRQGGDVHTDSVNHPVPFSYLLLACTAPATIGGETILVRAPDMVRELEMFPDVLATLRQDFWFEGRGMGEKVGFFKAPVLFERNGELHFRYLRGYIEGAHRKCGEPLTAAQSNAFDIIDALLETSTLQNRLSLKAGDILITVDTQVFHGRTSFIDSGSNEGWSPHRHMFRLWVEEPGSRAAA